MGKVPLVPRLNHERGRTIGSKYLTIMYAIPGLPHTVLSRIKSYYTILSGIVKIPVQDGSLIPALFFYLLFDGLRFLYNQQMYILPNLECSSPIVIISGSLLP